MSHRKWLVLGRKCRAAKGTAGIEKASRDKMGWGRCRCWTPSSGVAQAEKYPVGTVSWNEDHLPI